MACGVVKLIRTPRVVESPTFQLEVVSPGVKVIPAPLLAVANENVAFANGVPLYEAMLFADCVESFHALMVKVRPTQLSEMFERSTDEKLKTPAFVELTKVELGTTVIALSQAAA